MIFSGAGPPSSLHVHWPHWGRVGQRGRRPFLHVCHGAGQQSWSVSVRTKVMLRTWCSRTRWAGSPVSALRSLTQSTGPMASHSLLCLPGAFSRRKRKRNACRPASKFPSNHGNLGFPAELGATWQKRVLPSPFQGSEAGSLLGRDDSPARPRSARGYSPAPSCHSAWDCPCDSHGQRRGLKCLGLFLLTLSIVFNFFLSF